MMLEGKTGRAVRGPYILTTSPQVSSSYPIFFLILCRKRKPTGRDVVPGKSIAVLAEKCVTPLVASTSIIKVLLEIGASKGHSSRRLSNRAQTVRQKTRYDKSIGIFLPPI